MDHKADPNRHSFLHSDECNVLWKEFVQCRNEHYILRYFDYCSTQYSDVLRCFKKERRAKAEINHKLAEKERKKTVDRMAKELTN